MSATKTVTTNVPDLMSIKERVRDVEGAVRIRKGQFRESDDCLRPFFSDVEDELVKIRAENDVHAILELTRDVEGMCQIVANTFPDDRNEHCIFLMDIVSELRAIRTGLEERSIPPQPKKPSRTKRATTGRSLRMVD
ncbi:MAG: hypothetical protein OJF52_003486 [Nitrospira sp.]|jgi:hypothetical protein|nr:MAG: hypothetical protein OJF52_003486 [Nitrospira sp.]